MSLLGKGRSDVTDDVVLVFRPPENPAAQIAGITPFKSLRLKLDELLDWFKGLNVDSIELWIEGAYRSGNRTELFLSLEGKTGAKLTLRPFSNRGQAVLSPGKVENEAPDGCCFVDRLDHRAELPAQSPQYRCSRHGSP